MSRVRFPIRVVLDRNDAGLPVRQAMWRKPHLGRGRIALLAGLVGSLTVVSALPAAAATSGSTTAQINVTPPPVRSVTVSPATITFDSCAQGGTSTGSALSLPNGICSTTTSVGINNGTVPGHIDVQGADAIPSDNGTHWTLVPNAPGVDQFQEHAQNGGESGPLLTTNPQCDTSFSAAPSVPTCTVAPGQFAPEQLNMTGPSSSTDSSSSFTTVWTWTAVP